jgi:hypothetical protein
MEISDPVPQMLIPLTIGKKHLELVVTTRAECRALIRVLALAAEKLPADGEGGVLFPAGDEAGDWESGDNATDSVKAPAEAGRREGCPSCGWIHRHRDDCERKLRLAALGKRVTVLSEPPAGRQEPEPLVEAQIWCGYEHADGRRCVILEHSPAEQHVDETGVPFTGLASLCAWHGGEGCSGPPCRACLDELAAVQKPASEPSGLRKPAPVMRVIDDETDDQAMTRVTSLVAARAARPADGVVMIGSVKDSSTFSCCETPVLWPAEGQTVTCPDCRSEWEREPVDIGAGARLKVSRVNGEVVYRREPQDVTA